MQADPHTVERQRIVDELQALLTQQYAEQQTVADRFRVLRKSIEDRCGELGHVFGPHRYLTPGKLACVICSAVAET